MENARFLHLQGYKVDCWYAGAGSVGELSIRTIPQRADRGRPVEMDFPVGNCASVGYSLNKIKPSASEHS